MGWEVLGAGTRRARRLVLLVGLVFAALPAGSALADTTIGQVGFSGNFGCGPGAIGDPNYVVPSNRRGSITSFSFQSAPNNAGQQLDFLVLQPAGGNDYTVIGKSGLVTLKGTGPEPETFPTVPIPVHGGGQILGWWAPPLLNCFHSGSGRGLPGNGDVGDPNVGDTFSLGGSIDGFDLNESANLARGLGAPPPPPPRRCERGDRDDKSRCRHNRHSHHRDHHHHHHHEKN